MPTAFSSLSTHLAETAAVQNPLSTAFHFKEKRLEAGQSKFLLPPLFSCKFWKEMNKKNPTKYSRHYRQHYLTARLWDVGLVTVFAIKFWTTFIVLFKNLHKTQGFDFLLSLNYFIAAQWIVSGLSESPKLWKKRQFSISDVNF